MEHKSKYGKTIFLLTQESGEIKIIPFVNNTKAKKINKIIKETGF